jgi:hypothetical protein
MPNIRTPFGQIHQPGTYVSTSGDLFRIPPEALAEDHSPLIEIVSDSNTTMTMISENPWLAISKARQFAADADLPVHF